MAEQELQFRQDTGWVDLPHDYPGQFSTFRARKINGVVFVEIPRAVSGGNTQHVTTLPAGMCPSAEVRFVAQVWGAASAISGWIRTNGTVVLNVAADTSSVVCNIPPFIAA